MFQRLASFARSNKKKAVLRYFYYELKGDFRRFLERFLHAGKSYSPGNGYKVSLAGQPGRFYGSHRSGWSYAVKSLRPLHHPAGVQVDAFIDRTFALDARRPASYSTPWIGFIHVPPGVPGWLHSKQSNPAIFSSEGWKQSAPFCRGLFTLSAYHRKYLEPMFDFPVENLLHPTEFPRLTWSFERFAANPDKKIIQSGWWLRRVYSIYLLQVRGYRKVILLKEDADVEHHLKLELEQTDRKELISGKVMESVSRMNFLSNKRYDQLLSENIVFLDLIDASANNAIIECIARNTPVLVNKIEPVTEYLGTDYPFYYHSLEEAAEKAENTDLVIETHNYLASLPLKDKLTGDHFRQSFINSAIYQSL